MLEHLLFDAAFAVGSSIADNLSTYAMVKKHGIDVESNLWAREMMRHEGAGPFLARNAAECGVGLMAVGAGLYGIDYALGIQENIANLHHAFIYIWGSMKYLAAASNTFHTLGMRQVANVARLPVIAFLKIVSPLVDKTIAKWVRKGNEDNAYRLCFLYEGINAPSENPQETEEN